MSATRPHRPRGPRRPRDPLHCIIGVFIRTCLCALACGGELAEHLLRLGRGLLAHVALADVRRRPSVPRGPLFEQRHEAGGFGAGLDVFRRGEREDAVRQVDGVRGREEPVALPALTDKDDLLRSAEMEVEGGERAPEGRRELFESPAQTFKDGLSPFAQVLAAGKEREPQKDLGGHRVSGGVALS